VGCDGQQLQGFTGTPLPENLKVNAEELLAHLQLQGATTGVDLENRP